MSERDELLAQLSPFASAVTLQQSGIGAQDTAPYFPSQDLFADDANPNTFTTRQFAVYAFVKWLASALVSPLEVANIVKQVQYLPSDAPAPANEEEENQDHEHEGFDSDADEADPYHFPEEDEPKHKDSYHPGVPATADASGYLVHSAPNDDATKPPYQLPELRGSTWATIGDIVRVEGFTALWKGQTASWVHDVAESLIQPTIEATMLDAGLSDDSVSTYIGSHTLVGFLLSPLELVRTRLVLQTLTPYHRKYHGTYHCLSTLIAEEGLLSLYLNRTTFPTILYYTLESFFKISTSTIIEDLLGVSPEHQPLAYLAAEIFVNAIELSITLPLETIRRRLYAQIITRTPSDKQFETVVQRCPIPYAGMVDCGWRIVTEEGGRRRRRRKGEKEGERGWWDSWGLGPLYKGFKMRLIAQACVVLLNAIVSGIEITEE